MIPCKLISYEIFGHDSVDNGIIYKATTKFGHSDRAPVVGTSFVMTTNKPPIETFKTGYIRAVEWTGAKNGGSWENCCIFYCGPDIFMWIRESDPK